MSKKDAVIFDWAGTTVDYGCFAPVRAFLEVFREFGVEATVEEVREPMGMLKWDHIRTMLNMPRIHALWNEHYGRNPEDGDADKMYASFEPMLLGILKDYAAPKPYVLETVAELRKKGIKIGSTTGYTDIMMDRIVPRAKEQGYAPDCWFSPNAVEDAGRPYPYMIFRNMQTLKLESVSRIIKVGDTISDIQEAKNAGVMAVGILEGSSLMGVSEEEYHALDSQAKDRLLEITRQKYLAAGADAVIMDIRGVLELV